MPRIRTIKPEFWVDEKMSQLDPLTRLVFLGLISMADDAGRLIDNVKLLDGQLFPNTDDTCRDALETLARLSRITRYKVASGQGVIQIAKWEAHQRVDHPNKHVLPGPAEAVEPEPVDPTPVRPPLAKPSRERRETLANGSRDPRATTLDLGPRTSTNDLRSSSASDDATGTNWVAEGVELWRAKVGDVTHPRFGKALSGCVASHGWPLVRDALAEYADAPANGRPKRVEWFAQDVIRWIAEASEPLVEDGVLTAKGRRFMGVAS